MFTTTTTKRRFMKFTHEMREKPKRKDEQHKKDEMRRKGRKKAT